MEPIQIVKPVKRSASPRVGYPYVLELSAAPSADWISLFEEREWEELDPGLRPPHQPRVEGAFVWLPGLSPEIVKSIADQMVAVIGDINRAYVELQARLKEQADRRQRAVEEELAHESEVFSAASDGGTLTSEELEGLDRAYEPFPLLRDWGNSRMAFERWDRARAELDTIAANAEDHELRGGRDRAIRAASFDTGAIEGLYRTDRGLTRTVAEQTATWEQAVAQQPNALELFRAQLDAYELILDAVTKGMPQITQAWLRRLHEVLTEPQETYEVLTSVGVRQQPFPHGAYKQYPNHVHQADGTTFSYAPVADTQSEVARLLDEINGDAFSNEHPVIQAAYSHYALVRIHPFADGNGRVARGISSIFTYRATRTPLLVLADQRDKYLDALQAADRGDVERFIAFIESASCSALELVAETMRAAAVPSPSSSLARLAELRIAQDGLTHNELDQVGSSLMNVFTDLARKKAEALATDGVGITVEPLNNFEGAPQEGYRRNISEPHGAHLLLHLTSAAPAEAAVDVRYWVQISQRSDPARTFVVFAQGAQDDRLFMPLDDVRPISASAELKLDAFLDRTLGQGLGLLATIAEDSLRSAGYEPPPDTVRST